MIDCYCKVCGLYISIPDEYAGGRGACPRCRSQLRIPIPLRNGMPGYVQGLRYIAPSMDEYADGGQFELCDEGFGTSDRFRCEHCGQQYESINTFSQKQGQCPSCKHENESSQQDMKFPREYARRDQSVAESLQEPEKTPLPAERGFLIIDPVDPDDVNPSDTVIDGISLEDDGGQAPQPVQEVVQEEEFPVVPQRPKNVEKKERRTTHPLHRPKASQNNNKVIPAEMNIRPGEWAYFIRGEIHGPVSTDMLKSKLLTGELSQAVLVWKPGQDGFLSADRFDELRVNISHHHMVKPPVVRTDDPLSSTRTLLQRINSLLWMNIIVWAVLIIAHAVKQPLLTVGSMLFTVVVICIMAVGIAGLGVSAMLVKYIRLMVKAGSVATIKWVITVIGFIVLLIACLSSLSQYQQTEMFHNTALYESLAGDSFNSICNGNLAATIGKVDWDAISVNGRNFGGTISSLHRERDRQEEMKKVMETIAAGLTAAATSPATSQPASAPTGNPTTAPAVQIKPDSLKWEVMSQTVDKTVVRAKLPAGKNVFVTVKRELVTSVEFK